MGEPTKIHLGYPGAKAQKYGINPNAKVTKTVDMNVILRKEMLGQPSGVEEAFSSVQPEYEMAHASGVTVKSGKKIGDLMDEPMEEQPRAAAPSTDPIGHPHEGCEQAGLLKEIPGRPGVYRCTGCGAQMVPRRR